jgi:hypothetical protein
MEEGGGQQRRDLKEDNIGKRRRSTTVDLQQSQS